MLFITRLDIERCAVCMVMIPGDLPAAEGVLSALARVARRRGMSLDEIYKRDMRAIEERRPRSYLHPT